MNEKTNQNIQLLSAKALAKMLSLSPRTIWRLRSSGKLPEPVKVGGAIRWRLEQDIKPWLSMGCPDRMEFERFKDLVDGGEK